MEHLPDDDLRIHLFLSPLGVSVVVSTGSAAAAVEPKNTPPLCSMLYINGYQGKSLHCQIRSASAFLFNS